MSLLSERDITGQSKGYWWEKRLFTHPQTNNQVGFKSLPLEEQKRLNDMVRKNTPEKFKPEPSKPPEPKEKVEPQVKPQPKEKVEPQVKPKEVEPQVKPKEVEPQVKPQPKKKVKPQPKKEVKPQPKEKPVKNMSPVKKEAPPAVKEKPKLDKGILNTIMERLSPAKRQNLQNLLKTLRIRTKEKGVEDKEKAKRKKEKEFKDKHQKGLMSLLERFKFDKKEMKIVSDIFSHIYSTDPNHAIALMEYLESLEEDKSMRGM